MNILGKRSDLPFSRKSDRKKEKSTVSFTHVQNIICSQTLSTVSRHCAWVDHYLKAVICRSRGELSANEKKGKFASIDNSYYLASRNVPQRRWARRNVCRSQASYFMHSTHYLFSDWQKAFRISWNTQMEKGWGKKTHLSSWLWCGHRQWLLGGFTTTSSSKRKLNDVE